ncbi:MAG: hypothetical protein ACLVE7_05555 [Coprococcus comes]
MKKIITVMLCIVLVLLFAGCGKTAIHQKWKLIMEHLPFIQKKK